MSSEKKKNLKRALKNGLCKMRSIDPRPYIVMDDDADLLNMLSCKLGKIQTVKTCSTELELIEQIMKCPDAVVVLDVQMVPLSGIQLAEKLNLHKIASQLIFMSNAPLNEKQKAKVKYLNGKFIQKSDQLFNKIALKAFCA
jgi:two-component SAPR family response regulator